MAPIKCFFVDRFPLDPDNGDSSISQVCRRLDTGEECMWTEINKVPGAMWYADHYLRDWYAEIDPKQYMTGPDGHVLVVCCPDGWHWIVDSRANNCTLPNDNEHRCWVRHGDPRSGLVHVDKNGKTCAAGAGSIVTPSWHGFLHNGYLTGC